MGLVGKKIGPYTVTSQIGSGGMAVVYRAEQPTLRRDVAIKELRDEFANDPSIVARFEREAQSIASLAHQNIVHVYDFITRGTSMFIVMEHVDGIDLYDLINRVERLPPDIAAIIGLQAARALEYAHYHGVVHRDFKPSNLMITKQGDVKLMDFGIARDQSNNDLTRPGQALGTPSYMSPEQIMGERVDFRSDVFSFGIVLYQMLTGQKPFLDDETVGVMQRILNENYPRPRAVFPDIPWALQSIVRRCLQKDPKRRFESTEALRKALEKYVARNVRINYAGRLVIYLRNKEVVTDNEARTYVREEDLMSIGTRSVDSGAVRGWTAVLRPLLLTNLALFLFAASATAVVHWTGVGAQPAYIRVNAVPWAEVYVDGKLFDMTPFSDPIVVSPGPHALEFRNQHFETVVRELTLAAGENQRVHVELQRRRR